MPPPTRRHRGPTGSACAAAVTGGLQVRAGISAPALPEGFTIPDELVGDARSGLAITDHLSRMLETTLPVRAPAIRDRLLIGLVSVGAALRRRGWQLLLALACSATGTSQAQQLHVEGYACAGECSLYSQQSVVPPLSDMVLQGTGSSEAQSAAEADFGVLRLLSTVTGFATSQAEARFSDALTILPTNPVLIGEFGLLEWRLALSGRGDLLLTTADGYGMVYIDAVALGAAPGTGRATSQWFSEIGGPVQFVGDALPWTVVVRQGFYFGEPFEIGFQLHATTSSVGAIALADLMHTATWDGITAVSLNGVALDANNDYALHSTSGTDYRGAITPVPELPPALLLVLGIGALGLHRRRRRVVS